jgi:RHS repeat-associated protein
MRLLPWCGSDDLRGTYTYNGLEQLAIRVMTNQTPSGTVHSLYDRAGNLLAETAGGGATGSTGTTREYIWLPDVEIAPTFGSRTKLDRPVAVVADVNTTPVMYWAHIDHLHRPVKMTNAAKATVWNAVWKPWGEPEAITGTASLDARFPGQWFQIEAGLHYNWHRHYDASIGRYTQPDPLGFVDGPSVYGYAVAKPLTRVDPRGLQIFTPPKRKGYDPKDPQCFSTCYMNEFRLCGGAGVTVCAAGCVLGAGPGAPGCVLGCGLCTFITCKERVTRQCS